MRVLFSPSILIGILVLAVLALYFPFYTMLAGNMLPDVYIFIVMIVLLVVMTATMDKRYIHFCIILAGLPLLGFYCRPWRFESFHMVDSLLIFVVLVNLLLRSSQSNNLQTNSHVKVLFASLLVWLFTWLALGTFGIDFVQSSLAVLRMSSILWIALGLLFVGDRGRDPRLLIRGVRVALTICSFFVLMQVFFGRSFTLDPYLNVNVGDVSAANGMRYPGPMQDPQSFGHLLAVLVLFCLFFYRFDHPLLTLIVGFLGVCCIVLAGSRGPFFGLLCGALAASIVARKGRAIVGGVALLLASIIVYGYVSGSNDIILIRRLAEFDQGAQGRISIWTRSLAIFQAYPITGIGTGNFAKIVLQFDPTAYWNTTKGPIVFEQPESSYLKVLLETGVIGFTVFCAVFLLSLIRYIRSVRDPNLEEGKKGFLVGGFAAYVSLLVGIATVNTLADHRILFVFGFLTALPYFYLPIQNRQLR